MYISEVQELPDGMKVPLGLARIYTQSQKSNRTHVISGALSYSDGRYIQVLEGEDTAVDCLYQNIVKDDRHRNVRKILEESTQDRFFPGWDMKLIISVERNKEFINFITHFLETLAQLPETEKSALARFYKLPALPIQKSRPQSTQQSTQPDLQSLQYSLSGWPDFNQFAPTPEIIVLCSKLTSRPYSVSELVNDHPGDPDKLKRDLAALADTGLLHVFNAPIEEAVNSEPGQPVPEKEGKRFFEKMRHFLGFDKA